MFIFRSKKDEISRGIVQGKSKYINFTNRYRVLGKYLPIRKKICVWYERQKAWKPVQTANCANKEIGNACNGNQFLKHLMVDHVHAMDAMHAIGLT